MGTGYQLSIVDRFKRRVFSLTYTFSSLLHLHSSNSKLFSAHLAPIDRYIDFSTAVRAYNLTFKDYSLTQSTMSDNSNELEAASREAKSTVDPVKSFLSGGFGGISCVLVGHPFDLTKTRLQTAAPGTYSGAIDVVRKTVAADGIKGYIASLVKVNRSELIGPSPVNSQGSRRER